MTLRRSVHISLLATAIAVGVTSLPVAAQAAGPAAASRAEVRPEAATLAGAGRVHVVGAADLGDDPVAAVAVRGLTAWNEYRISGDRKALQVFNGIRDAIAAEAALRVEGDPVRMKAAWRAADATHQLVLMSAFTQLGTPYRSRARTPGRGFDCSGLTSWTWAQVGVQLERVSRDQIRTVPERSRETAQAGDLIYYPGHVSLYLGVDNFIVHAPYSGRSVEFGHISNRRTNSVRFGNPIGDFGG